MSSKCTQIGLGSKSLSAIAALACLGLTLIAEAQQAPVVESAVQPVAQSAATQPAGQAAASIRRQYGEEILETRMAALLLLSVATMSCCDRVVSFEPLPYSFGIMADVIDSSTHKPIEDDVSIVATSADSSWELSRSTDVLYVGVLEPGVYSVRVEAEGYAPQLIENVTVARMTAGTLEGLDPVNLNIHLDPLP